MSCNEIENRNVDQNQSQTIEENSSQEINESNDESTDLQTVDEIIKVKVTVDKLEIRERFTDLSNVKGHVYINSVYEVLDIKEDTDGKVWYRISIRPNTDGWIASEFTEVADDKLYDYNKEFKEIEIDLKENYEFNDQDIFLSLRDLISWQGKVFITVNGQKKENVELNQEGLQSVTFVFEDELGRMSNPVHKKTFIYNPNGQLKKIYSHKDIHSDWLDVINIEKIKPLLDNKATVGHVQIKNGETELWYEISYGSGSGFIYEKDINSSLERVYLKNYKFILKDGTIIDYSQEHAVFKVIDMPVDSGVIHVDGKYNVFVDSYNGSIYEVQDYEISPDGKYLFGFDRSYVNGLGNVLREEHLLSLNNGFHVLYQDSNIHMGLNDIEWLEDDTLTYVVNHNRMNTWQSISLIPVKTKVQIKIKPEGVSKKIIEDADADVIFTDIDVFLSMSRTSALIEKISSDDLFTIEFMDTLEMTEEGILVWYYVELLNGKTGYISREKNVFDENNLSIYTGIHHHNMDLIFLNGDRITIRKYELPLYSVLLSDDFLFLDMLAHTTIYEGVYHSFYSVFDGQRLDVPIEGDYYFNESKSLIVDMVHDYSGETSFSVYRIVDGEFKLEYRYDGENEGFKFAGWNHDESFNILISDYIEKTEKESTLYFEDELWNLDIPD